MKYTLKKDENYGQVLQKDGKDCFCPFQSGIAVPVQTAMGGMNMSIMRMPCSDLCPLARVKEEGSAKFYKIICSGTIEKFQLEENEESKVVSLV